MAALPPPPTNDATGSYAWLEWFRQLRTYISTVGSVPWNIIDFTGSTLSSIASRSHQVLQALQGGTTGEYYHLTSSEYTGSGTGVFARTGNPTLAGVTVDGLTYVGAACVCWKDPIAGAPPPKAAVPELKEEPSSSSSSH